MLDKFKDECGVFGIFGHPEAATSPTSACTRCSTAARRAPASPRPTASRCACRGRWATSPTSSTSARSRSCRAASPIGHVRYSTAGESKLANAQPILIDCAHGQIAIGHNGNLVNARELRDELVRERIDLPDEQRHRSRRCISTRARRRRPSKTRSSSRSRRCSGAFSLVLLTKDRLIAVRDPHGFRPLALGRLGDACVVCSETCALDLIGATYVRDVEPGEVLVISAGGPAIDQAVSAGAARRTASSSTSTSRGPTATCSAAASTRCAPSSAACWRASSRSTPTSSCRSPTPASAPRSGYAEESGIPLRMGLIRNHYVGRTFIEPQQSIRHFGVQSEAESRCAASSTASASCSSTTRSCAARRAARSSRWCAPPARRKCTCASAVRRRSRRASTASTRRRRSGADRRDAHARGDPRVSSRPTASRI